MFSRRSFLSSSAALGGLGIMKPAAADGQTSDAQGGGFGLVGTVDHSRNGFDPHHILSDWDTGDVSDLADGRRLREFQIVASDMEVEIAPGILFPAWVYNGRIPGPTLRAIEGDADRGRFRACRHCRS